MRKRRSVSLLSDSDGLASCLMTSSAQRGSGEPTGEIYGKAALEMTVNKIPLLGAKICNRAVVLSPHCMLNITL